MRHGPEIRGRAAALFAEGATCAQVARRLGIARSTSSAWYRLWERQGLLAAGRPGRRPRMGREQLARVGRALLEAPSTHGIGGDAWSLRAIALLIERQTGMRFHHRHVARLVQRMGWLAPPLERYDAAARFVVPVVTGVGPMNLLVPKSARARDTCNQVSLRLDRDRAEAGS